MSPAAGLLCSFQNDTAGQQWTQDPNQQRTNILNLVTYNLNYIHYYSQQLLANMSTLNIKKSPSLIN